MARKPFKVRENEMEPIAEGTYAAWCYSIVGIGTHENEYQGKVTKKEQLILSFELATELIESGDNAGKPIAQSKFYTRSMNSQSNLAKDIKNWGVDVVDEDITMLLDVPCLLTITHTDKGKAKISGVSALPKGMDIPPKVNDDMVYDVAEDDKGQGIDLLPEWQQKQCMKSEEWNEMFAGDTPF